MRHLDWHIPRRILRAERRNLKRFETCAHRAQKLRYKTLRSLQSWTVLIWLLATSVSWGGQNEANRKRSQGDGLPTPKTVTLKTRDGHRLKATYYGQPEDKKAVPIVMLHDHEGERNDYDALAVNFQTHLGHAVIIPDLRGHGESAGRRDAKDINKSDVAKMIYFDMAAVRKFIKDKNNEGEVNLEKLCLIGAGMGAVVAIKWAEVDWSYPPLATGKQGQDVKALILLSPDWSFEGVPINKALAHQRLKRYVSFMVMVGKQEPSAVRDAKKVHKAVSRSRSSDSQTSGVARVVYAPLPTDTQGTGLVQGAFLNANPNVAKLMIKFIDARLVKRDFPWSDRRRNF